MIYQEIKQCRICGNNELLPIIDLGVQALTGVFPKDKDELIESGPLVLVKCSESAGKDACGLVQLQHNYDLEKLYGDNYGYRSGLNKSMVDHLQDRVKKIKDRVSFEPGDLIVDIGSNDSTLLREYGDAGLKLVGIDPTAEKFKEFYPSHIQYVADFFSERFIRQFHQKAKVITSIAMFYDLEQPMDFVQQIKESLAPEGIWVFEQSYMPTMIEKLAYDTICHEHLEYYALRQIKWMTDRLDMKIIDVELNAVNGGSFAVTVAHKGAAYPEVTALLEEILSFEKENGFSEEEVYKEFGEKILEHRKALLYFLEKVRQEGKIVAGYGASTKGNVLLQYCGLTERDIPYIAEVNEFKFGRYTPGSKIPIVSEREARERNPDYFMVLPWHFKEGIIKREGEYRKRGGKFFFPLPALEVV